MPMRKEQALIKKIRRVTLMLCAVFLPLYLAVRITGGSGGKLEELPNWIDRLKNPVEWKVPEEGVSYLYFFHGEPSSGHKFVLIKVHLQAHAKLGYPIVPRCFRLVDDQDRLYYPLSRSPLFIERSDEFFLDQGDVIEAELLFEIPVERDAIRLLFDRYQEHNSKGGE